MLFADPAVRCWSPAEAAVTHVRLVPSADSSDSVQVLAVHGPHVSVSTPFQPTQRTAEQVERAEANPPSTSRLWSDWGGNAREHWSKRVTCLTVMRTAEDSLGCITGCADHAIRLYGASVHVHAASWGASSCREAAPLTAVLRWRGRARQAAANAQGACGRGEQHIVVGLALLQRRIHTPDDSG